MEKKIISFEDYTQLNGICNEVIGAAIEVHKELGPGLMESVYQYCLIEELTKRGLSVESELELPLVYKGKEIGKTFRIDLLVEDDIVIELKSVEELKQIHEVQLVTYLKLTNKPIGLLMNFNVPLLTKGVKRKINAEIRK
ncbi:MAG: GxxExxY protein [Prevotella sp.]